MIVSTHSRAEAAALDFIKVIRQSGVSTHSRAEAAANTDHLRIANPLFQHTAARRRLLGDIYRSMKAKDVSTHSRAEAAAFQ